MRPAESIFISHHSHDQMAAAKLKDQLLRHGYLVVFVDFDPEYGIPAGRVWEREFHRLLRTCGAVIVLLSRAAVSSRWVFAETAIARSMGKVVLAFRVDETKPSELLLDIPCIDATAGWDSAVEKLVLGLLRAGLGPISIDREHGARSFQSCFISYSSDDQDFADKLFGDLTDAGVRCWLRRMTFKQGERFMSKF